MAIRSFLRFEFGALGTRLFAALNSNFCLEVFCFEFLLAVSSLDSRQKVLGNGMKLLFVHPGLEHARFSVKVDRHSIGNRRGHGSRIEVAVGLKQLCSGIPFSLAPANPFAAKSVCGLPFLKATSSEIH